jgi:hypothetical protein
MAPKSIRAIVFHGLLLVVLGMVAGIPFREAITGGWGAEAERAWRVAHTSLVGGGALYLALSAAAPHLSMGPRADAFVVRALVLAAWAFAFAFLVGPALGARGLEPGGGAANTIIFGVFAVALAAAFGAFLILLRAAWLGMRES